MVRFRLFLFLLVLLPAISAHGQNVQTHLTLSSSHIKYSFPAPRYFILNPPLSLQNFIPLTYPCIPVFGYDPHLAKGAVFCRLENHFCEHYNIWLKIRAGDVEEYHRQIEKKQ
jgi:hypothetical protein